jgi:hypothetical protein
MRTCAEEWEWELKEAVGVDLTALTFRVARNIYERFDNGREPLVIITLPCQNF